MKFDINAARSAGYSDDEIADYLASQNNFDLGGALQSGYTASDVIGFLSGATAPEPVTDTGDETARLAARYKAPEEPSLISRVAKALKPAPKSVLEGYQPTPQERQAERERRLSLGAGPISQQTAAQADLVRSGMAKTDSPIVKKVAKSMEEQGTPSFGDLVTAAKNPVTQRMAREAKADEFRTPGEWAVDTLSNLSQGAVGLVQLPINIIAPSSEVAETLRETQKELQAAESDVLKANRERLKERVLSESGFLDQYVATVKELVTNPTLTISEAAKQIPNFLAIVGAARTGGLVAGGSVAAAGRVSPTLALGEAISGGAIQSAARVAGTAAGGAGASMVMAGGDAAGNVYEALTSKDPKILEAWKQNPDYIALREKKIAAGMSAQEAGQQAVEELATTKARMAALITAPLGLLGYMGAEAAVASKGLGRAAADAITVKGLAKTAGKDLIGEQLEEGGTQFGANVVKQTVNPEQSLTEGVPEAMGTALVTSAPFTAVGLRSQYQNAMQSQPADIGAERAASYLLDPNSYDPALVGTEQTVRQAEDVGPSAPTRTVNFTEPDSATAQAGLTPVVVPVPQGVDDVSTTGVAGPAVAGSGQLASDLALPSVGDAGLAGVDALRGAGDSATGLAPVGGEAAPVGAGAGQQPASVGLPRPLARATDADLLARTEAAVAAQENNNAVVEPTEQWFGRKGDGYVTEADAMQALPGRQRMFPTIDWKVEEMPSGKFRLAGYSQETTLGTQTTQALQAETQGQEAAASAGALAAAAPAIEAPKLQDSGVQGLKFAPPAPVREFEVFQRAVAQDGIEIAPLRVDEMSDQHKVASVVARMLGKTYTVARVTSGDPMALSNGMINKLGGKNIVAAENTEDAPLFVAMHEAYHGLPEADRKALNTQLLGLFKMENKTKFLKDFNYTEETFEEEAPAFMAQVISKRQDFWEELRTKMGNGEFAGVAKVILGSLNQILRKVSGAYGEDFADTYISDVVKARNLLTDAYAKSMREQGLTPDTDVTGVVSSNRIAPTTPEFKSWFGKSKVRDEAGEPLVVYHGTNSDFTSFDDSASGSNSGNTGFLGRGFYFSRSPQSASMYAGASRPRGSDTWRRTDGGNVMPVYLSLQNPLEISERGLSKEAADALNSVPGIGLDLYEGARSVDGDLALAVEKNPGLSDAIRSALTELGYDGVVLDGGREIVAFRPEQIKSATGNNGQYDPTNSDIRRSNRTEIGASLQQRIDTDFDGAAQEYASLKGTKGGRLLDTDIARELSPEYRADRTRSAEVHDAASGFIQREFERRLETVQPGGQVVFMAGGGGAGKSSAEALLAPLLEQAHTVYDGTLSSYDKAERNIQMALDAGQRVTIAYVYREPEEAFRNGVLTRAMRAGRTVPIGALVKGHAGSSEAVRKLQEKFGDNPLFRIRAVDNSRGPGAAQLTDLSKITPVIKSGLKERFENAARQEYEAGRISESVYRATTQSRPDARAVGAGQEPDGRGRSEVEGVLQERRGSERERDAVTKDEAVVDGVRYSTRKRNLVDIPTIELKDLVGKKVFGIKADLTDAGRSYAGIDGSQLEFPVEMMGGPNYVRLPENAKANVIWAVRGGAVLTKIMEQVKKSDYVLVHAMNGNSHLTNSTISSAYLQTVEAYLRDGRISQDNLKALDEIVRSPKNKSGLPDFPGFESPEIYSYIDGLSFDQRGALASILEKKEAQIHGLPNLERFRRETIDPEFSGYRQGDAMLVLKVDKENPTVKLGENGTKLHPSYPLGLRGTVIGKLSKGINYETIFRDYFKFAVPNFKNKEAGAWYAFDRKMPIQKITQEIADSVAPGSFKSITTARQAEAALAFANGNWLMSGKTKAQGGISVQEFVDALRANEGAAALTLYTPEEVKAGIKDKSFTIYQLGKEGGDKGLQVFFGLKRGAPWYKDMIDGVGDNEVEVVSVTNNESGAPGIGIPAIITKAISEGATLLDAFAVKSARFPNGFLPEMYSQFGFEEIGRIAFDPSYYDANQMADLKAFWSRGGWREADGFPDVVVMRWKGNDEDRATAVERYVRSGDTGVSAEAPRYTRAATGELDQRGDTPRGRAGRARGGDAAAARGDQGAGDAASVVQRAYGSIQELASLGDGDIRNLGLDPAEVQRLRDELAGVRRSNRFAELARGPGARADEGSGRAITGIHYGKSAGLSRLSGAAFGSGIKGAEQARLAEPGVDPRIKKRVYFYLTNNNADMPRPEIGLGSHVYRASLGNLFDMATASIAEKQRVQSLRKTPDANGFESAVLDAGFRGYVNREQGTAVVLNADVPVVYEGMADASRMRDRMIQRVQQGPVTRTEGDELVRKPSNDEMIGIIRARPALAEAAPSFKLEFGEARVKQSEAEAADRVLAEAGSTFQFGGVMRSNRATSLEEDLQRQQTFLQERAQAAGYNSIDEFVEADYEGFVAAAKDWRADNEVEVMYSNRVSPADRIKWRKISDVQNEIGLDALPRHIVPFARFMKTMSEKAANGDLTARDVIKAYTIARSSMNRSAVTTQKVQAAGLALPSGFSDPKIRPEGAFGYWLLSDAGQRYLNAAEAQEVDEGAIADAVKVMAPFGTQNALGEDLKRAANGDLHRRLPALSAAIIRASRGEDAVAEWQDATDNLYGVREAKKGFFGSLLGFGQLPTFDARQININVEKDSKEDTLRALSSTKARDVVDKLARRMDALSLTMDPQYAPFYRHLVHHAVWDAVGNTETTHSDVMESMVLASRRAVKRQRLVGSQFTMDSSGKIDQARIKLQDDALRMKRVIEAVKAKGGTVTDAQNFYDANTLMPGRIQAAIDDFKTDVLKPMLDQAAEYGIDLDELAMYSYAKHAKERNAYIASINRRMPDGGSGMTNDEADGILQLVDLAGDTSKFEDLHQRLMSITSTTRLLMLSEGLITQEEYDQLQGAYENYIPLRGFEDFDVDTGVARPGIGRGVNVRGVETIRAMGRKTKAGDLIENVIRDYERVVTRIEKNDVGKVLLDFVLSNPDPDLWGVDVERNKPAFNRGTGTVQYTNVVEKGEDTIGVKVGGQQVYIKFADKELTRALRQAWKDETSGLERATLAMTGWWNNWMRAVLTKYNPAFAAINIPRDALWSGTSAALDELGAKGLGLYLKNYGKAMMASARQELGVSGTTNAIFGNPQIDRMFQEFRAAGGITGGFYMRTLEDINKDLRNELLLSGASARNPWEVVKSLPPFKLAKLTLRMLEFLGASSENATRFALYMTSREMGNSTTQAARLAKDGTTNFNRKGEWGGALNNLYLFFNAAVQGTAQLAKVLKNPKVQAAMAGVAGVGMMLAAYGASAGGEDDDGEKYWDKIPSYVKERNLVIMLPPGGPLADGIERVGQRGRYITIPVQYGFNIFPNLGYMMSDVLRNAEDGRRGVTPTKAALHMASVVLGSINPFGGAVDVTDGVQVLLAASPTLTDLPIQIVNERGTFGSPSAPGTTPWDRRPDSERMFVSQQDTVPARIAKAINELGGGNEAKAGSIMGVETSVTPGTIQTLISATTGGLGSFVEQVGTSVIAMTGDDKDLKANKIPFLNKFYGEVDESANIRSAAERMAQIRKLSDEVKAQQKVGVDPELKDAERKLLALAGMQEAYTKQQSMMRKAELEIIKDSKLTDAEKTLKRKQIQVERDRLATEVNREYLKVTK